MGKSAVWLAGVVSLALVACASNESPQRSGARVVDIEETVEGDGEITVIRSMFHYSGDQLTEVVHEVNGEPAGRHDVTYADGRIERIDVFDKDGDRAIREYSYENEHIDTSVYYEPTRNYSKERFEYDASHGDRLQQATATWWQLDRGITTTWDTRVEYDDAGRVVAIIEGDERNQFITDLRYDEEGRLQRVDFFEGGNHVITREYSYDTDDRLTAVDDTDDGLWRLSYDQSGRVVEVRYIDVRHSETRTVRYTYGDGSVAGTWFAPSVPKSEFFDMSGRSFADLDIRRVNPFVLAIPSDIPEARDGEDDGGDSGTGQFAVRWRFDGETTGNPLTCEEAGVVSVRLRSVGRQTYVDLWDCSAYSGTTNPMPTGRYALTIAFLDEDNTVLTEGDLVEKTLVVGTVDLGEGVWLVPGR